MSDLRDAAELALTALENTCPNTWTSVKENLRKALAQPKREWVGLTDEEIWEVINRTAWVGTEEEIRFKIAEAILRKAQEK
jgi:hypothetical protein